MNKIANVFGQIDNQKIFSSSLFGVEKGNFELFFSKCHYAIFCSCLYNFGV